MTQGKRNLGEGVELFTTCSTAGPSFIHVKDGKIVRIEPMQFDPSDVKSWKVKEAGKEYKPPLTHPLLPWGLAGKKMAYGEERVLYPHKRVDWDPKGERNADKRGISGYERISWDEALGLIAYEYKRILEEAGPSALAYTHSAHPEWGSHHYLFSDLYRFRDMIGGTYLEFTPNSWEGWACGGPLLWGNWMAHGIPPANDTIQDITNYSDLVIFWGVSPVDHGVYAGIDTGRLIQYWKELGKTIICIDPLYNETGMASDALWYPIAPGTDGAFALAIAHQWILDGTYDADFLHEKCIGFDDAGAAIEYNPAWTEEHAGFAAGLPDSIPENGDFVSYVMGKVDGVEKTAEWAAGICGIKARDITALAKLWGSRPTSQWCMYGGACRRTSAHETVRLQAILALMHGMGSKGNNIIADGLSLSGPYDAVNQVGPTGYADGGMNCVLDSYYPNPTKGTITFTRFKDVMTKPLPQEWRGGHLDNWGPEMYFDDVTYPLPGHEEIQLLWQRGSTLTNPPHHSRHMDALRSEKLKTFIVAAPWFDRDCRYADLVLPTTTLFEVQDITEPSSVGQYVPPCYTLLRSAIYSRKAIEPLGESKDDVTIYEELCDRLGDDYRQMFTEGNSEEDILKKMYAKTNIPLTYDEFKEKGYYVWPNSDDYESPKQFELFHDLPFSFENCQDTPTGKVELYSTLVASVYGNDNPEISPVPHYIPEVEGVSDPLREKYPLQITMCHPKFRFHGKYNNISWLAENYKVYGEDGYAYEPCMISPADAAKRGIEDGEIIRAFNDRGEVLCGARVSNRVMPGTAWLTYGAWNDPMGPETDALDRGGDGNVLSNAIDMSCHHVGGSFNSVLFDVEKIDLDEVLAKYPDGVAGKYTSWKKGN